MSDLREFVQSALSALASGPLRDSATSLLKTLGYQSDRTLNLESSKPQAFIELIASHGGTTKFDKSKALFSDWKSADILFQLSDADISREGSLFKETAVQPSLLQSYLFFAIELKGSDYARGKLSAIARQINRVFPMPVMLLIRHGDASGAPVLSIAVINRRRNKVHAEKDVLEKVTLIRDISLTAPHRGHLDILASFAVPNLVHPKKLPITDFDTLHAAWEQIFNVELLRPDAGGNRHRGGQRPMNPPSEHRFPRLPLAKADAGASPGARLLRAKGPALYQPRAAPWVNRRKNHPSPEGATQPVRRRPMVRPFRAQWNRNPKPRALPWAGMGCTFGAEEMQRDFLTHLHQTLNAPSHPIRNRLLRLTADSPDLLAIIKNEGKV